MEDEVAGHTGPRAKAPMSAAERRLIKAELQELIQKLDELGGRLRG